MTDFCDAEDLAHIPAKGEWHFGEEEEGVETWPEYLKTQKPGKGDGPLQGNVLARTALEVCWIDFLESPCTQFFFLN